MAQYNELDVEFPKYDSIVNNHGMWIIVILLAIFISLFNGVSGFFWILWVEFLVIVYDSFEKRGYTDGVFDLMVNIELAKLRYVLSKQIEETIIETDPKIKKKAKHKYYMREWRKKRIAEADMARIQCNSAEIFFKHLTEGK